jgi:adenylate cyclase
MAAPADIDFEAEGLLDDLEGEAREARLGLLERLAGEGVSLQELRDAVAAGRLTLLPVERTLAGDGPRYTPREVAAISGVELDLLQRYTAAFGVPYPDPDERTLTAAEVEAARRIKAFQEAGLPDEGMLQVARTIGMGTARIAEANRELVIRTLMQPGDTERDLALRLAAAAEYMLPLIGPTLVHAFQLQMLEQVRRDVIGTADLASGEIGGTVELTICFADLVEFTRLGEEIAAEELGMVAGRLEEMASTVAEPPVRLVKTIGDAVMLVSTEAAPMVEATLALIAAAEAEGEEFPWLRAGLASGPTLPQSGDYYGRSVNLASRITGIARPGSVLVDATTREAAGERFSYSYVGERRLKGIDSRVKLFRARRGGG